MNIAGIKKGHGFLINNQKKEGKLTHNTFKTAVLLCVFSAWSFAFFSLPASAEEIYYDVPLIAQDYDTSCWAASLQMILTYFREQSFNQDDIAKAVGFSLDEEYGWEELQKAIKYWEFCVNPTACFLPEGWKEILRDRGPLWVVRRTGDKITHAIVLKGMSEDTESPTMYVNDPWPVGKGDEKEMTYEEFEQVYEAVEEEEPGYLIQILYYCGEKAKKPSEAEITDFRITYDVPLVAQDTPNSCWAAGIAMLISWRDEISIGPDKIAEPLSYEEQYNKSGLDPEDTAMFERWDLIYEEPQTFTVEGFKELLETYGPLWIATHELAPHIRVVTGIYGNGTGEGTTLLINDPLPMGKGSQYPETYLAFVNKESNLAEDELFNKKLLKPVYVVHCAKIKK